MAEQGDFWFNIQNWVNMYDGVWAVGKTPKANSPAVVKSLELWLDLYNAAIPKGITNAAATSLAANGRIAQGFWVSAAVNVLKTTNPKVYAKLRSVALPHASHKAASRVHPISLNKLGKNREEAVKFLTWLFKPENMAGPHHRLLGLHSSIPRNDKGPSIPEIPRGSEVDFWILNATKRSNHTNGHDGRLHHQER